MIAATRATLRRSASLASRRTKPRYRSREADVASMKSTASAELTSAENTAASATMPTAGGIMLASTVGSARSGLEIERLRAARPITAGAAAKISRANPFHAMPRRTAASSRAPYAFCNSPGDTTNAGPRRNSSRHPEVGPVLVHTLADDPGTAVIACHPPAPCTANGTAMAKPARITMS
jgi:hypothetical protein